MTKEEIKALRLSLGISQEEMAKRLKCVIRTVQNLEHGSTRPTKAMLRKLERQKTISLYMGSLFVFSRNNVTVDDTRFSKLQDKASKKGVSVNTLLNHAIDNELREHHGKKGEK